MNEYIETDMDHKESDTSTSSRTFQECCPDNSLNSPRLSLNQNQPAGHTLKMKGFSSFIFCHLNSSPAKFYCNIVKEFQN